MTAPTPEVRELSPTEGGQCDWGSCNKDATAMRWDGDQSSYLPVCDMHQTDAGSELHDLMIRADSVCSLVAYRHSAGLPRDVRQELIDVSQLARKAYSR